MWPALTAEYGNPSSSYELGRAAAVILEDARAEVAEVLGARASEVIFTSGGTESDNLAIKGLALANPRGRHVVTSSIEHPAVVEACSYLARFHGFEVTTVPVDSTGLVSREDVAAVVRGDTSLVSVMYANNEVGSIQPIAEVASIAHESGSLVHTDAVQAAGSLDIAVHSLAVDALSISGHKLGAPKGIGALWLRGGVPIEPLLHGGGQERGRRSGTENVAGAIGLGKALAMAERARRDSLAGQVASRDAFIARVLATIPAARLTGPAVLRLASHASFTFEGTSGEAIVLELERQGILASSGSACAAGRDDPSPVLLAMGVRAEVAQTAVRFTFDAATGSEILDVAAGLQVALAAVAHP
jgi:cysteine desulfurase